MNNNKSLNEQLPAAILFDMDDTIIDTYSASVMAWKAAAEIIASKHNRNAQETFNACWRADRQFFEDPEKEDWGRLNQVEAREYVVRQALDQLGWNDVEVSNWIGSFVIQKRVSLLEPFPNAISTLIELRKRGIVLALVTNGEATQQRAKINKNNITTYFDTILIEGEFGIGKPSAKVFKHVLETIGETAEDCWMVGDDLSKDIAGGHKSGLKTIWVDARKTGLPKHINIKPDKIINSISEIIA